MTGKTLVGGCLLVFGSLLAIGPAIRPILAQPAAVVQGEIREADTGRPLANAQVSLVGTRIGITTDASGRYLLRGLEPGSGRLRVQLLGYRPEEVPVTLRRGATTRGDIVLEREYLLLDEVVVTGTADRARGRQVAHSVARIVPSEIPEPARTVDQLLAGRIPGVTLQQSSGMAGSGTQIRLRGNVSVSLGNDPLVYVDGVRVRSEGYPKNAPRLGGDDRRSPNDTASSLDSVTTDVESDRAYAEGFDQGEPATPANAALALDDQLRTRVRVSGGFAEATAAYRDRYLIEGGVESGS